MTDASGLTLGLLLAWGTLVGLDLVSVPQMMIARPVIAGAVAGWIVGNVEAGLRVGVIMELFALDVLPVGAVRYPDYGPATVGAATLAGRLSGSWPASLGAAVFLGLALAALGGWSLQLVRFTNARDIQARSAALAAGEAAAIRALQYRGVARDVGRSLGLTGLGLAVAVAATLRPMVELRLAPAVAVVSLAVALAAGTDGALRRAGSGARLRWLAAGGAVGLLWALLR